MYKFKAGDLVRVKDTGWRGHPFPTEMMEKAGEDAVLQIRSCHNAAGFLGNYYVAAVVHLDPIPKGNGLAVNDVEVLKRHWCYFGEEGITLATEEAPHVWAVGDRVKVVGHVHHNVGMSLRMERAVGDGIIYVISDIQQRPEKWFKDGLQIFLNGWDEYWDLLALELVPDDVWGVGDVAYIHTRGAGFGVNKTYMLELSVNDGQGFVVKHADHAFVRLTHPISGRDFHFQKGCVSHYKDGPRAAEAVKPKPPEEKEEEVEERLRKELDADVEAVRKEYKQKPPTAVSAFFFWYKTPRGKKLLKKGSLSQICHAGMKVGAYEGAQIEVLGGINFLTQLHNHPNIDGLRSYLDYAITRGPAKGAFHRTSVDGAIKNGLRYNINKGIDELAVASVFVRMATEYPDRLETWVWALENGYSENVAAALFHTIKPYAAKGIWQIAASGTGHTVLEDSKVKDVIRFFSDKWEFPKEDKPMKEYSSDYRISRVLGDSAEGGKSGIAAVLRGVVGAGEDVWGGTSALDNDKLKLVADWFKKEIENV